MKLTFDMRREAEGAGKTRTLIIMRGGKTEKKLELSDDEYVELRGVLDSYG